MNDSFVLLAAVFGAFAAGIAIAAIAWWINVRRIVSNTPNADEHAPKRTRAPLVLLAVAGGLLASVAVLYAVTERTPTPPPAAMSGAAGATPAVDALAASLGVKGSAPISQPMGVAAAPAGGDLAAMTERLAKRLKEKTPDDRAGWALLARSYVELGRDVEAIVAFEKAGAAASSDELLRSEFDAAKKRAAGGTSAAGAATTPAATGALPAVATAVLLSGKVEMAKGMDSPQGKSAAVFVIVRDGEAAGAPLAAKRIAATAFPISFALSDEDSMLPGQKLSAAKKLSIRARLSQSGDAAPQPGDLESEPQSINVGKTDLTLQLSKRRP
jgi:cytochrome c-type biogenesis protein CcmH